MTPKFPNGMSQANEIIQKETGIYIYIQAAGYKLLFKVSKSNPTCLPGYHFVSNARTVKVFEN